MDDAYLSGGGNQSAPIGSSTNLTSNVDVPADVSFDSLVQIELLNLTALRLLSYFVCSAISVIESKCLTWFIPQFTLEAFVQTSVFAHEYTTVFHGSWLRESQEFCHHVVTKMQYSKVLVTFVYLAWTCAYTGVIYGIRRLSKLWKTVTAYITIAVLLTIALAAAIIDINTRQESVCITTMHNGFFLIVMLAEVLAHLVSLVLQALTIKRRKSKGRYIDQFQYLYLFNLIVRVPELSIIHPYVAVHPLLRIAIRAIPLVYEITFVILNRDVLETPWRALKTMIDKLN